MKTIALSRVTACAALVLFGLALAGCATSKTKRAAGGADSIEDHTFCLADRLYLRASPCPRLHVEVDAVEGCAPSKASLDKLRNFLGTYCQKPGGIEIVQSDVIPVHSAWGISPSALARKYLNGPPEHSPAPPAAFIYVLFYDYALCNRRPAAIPAPPRDENRNPHVDIRPYPAMIYMNTHRAGLGWEQKWNLTHEAGHVLGLAFRPEKASAGHCTDRACIMCPSVWSRYLGMQRRLCKRCVAQLAEAAKGETTTNRKFAGPVLIRSEPSYHVLSLPHRQRVVVGELAEQDCRAFAAAVRAEIPVPGDNENEQRADGNIKEEAIREPEKLRDIFQSAKADPDVFVRKIASRWWSQAWSQWHCSRGEYAAAVNIYREAVRLNSEDDWSYNQLAWIKATCPDPSVRDGQEAVSAATKACEITSWNEWNWIDTLAAAYAEAGDFKRAIELEEQALRAGGPSESDRKSMQERIQKYRQSQPFREKS